MTTTEPTRLQLKPTDVLEPDQILGYIAYRSSQNASYVDMSREMGMSDGWVSDLVNAVIKRPLYPTRLKVTERLRKEFGAEGIPTLDPTPVVSRAAGPSEAVQLGFGPRGGDPSRPLADPPAATELISGSTVEQINLAEEVMQLTRDLTRMQLAEQLLHLRDHAASLEARVTSMDNIHERMVAELNERDRIIAGQADDLEALEKTMDIQAAQVEDLQGFKDGVVTQLRQFAVLLWQVVPPEMWPSVPAGPYKTVGVETGRFSASSELSAAAAREYLSSLPDVGPITLEGPLQPEPVGGEPITLEIDGEKIELQALDEVNLQKLREALSDRWTITAKPQMPGGGNCPPGCKDHRHGYPWD